MQYQDPPTGSPEDISGRLLSIMLDADNAGNQMVMINLLASAMGSMLASMAEQDKDVLGLCLVRNLLQATDLTPHTGTMH